MTRIKKNGFTLVELLIVMAIMAILIVTLIGVINPIAMVNRGLDARRKKDLDRIKVSFEEYYNDKNCYPNPKAVSPETNYINEMQLKSNCGKSFFSPWLSIWPCDPNGHPYVIQVEDSNCPSWFKVAANLDTPSDPDIPAIVVQNSMTPLKPAIKLDGFLVNYGVSSTNIYWYDYKTINKCAITDKNCYAIPPGGLCGQRDLIDSKTQLPYSACAGANCYRDGSCKPECQTYYCDSRYP